MVPLKFKQRKLLLSGFTTAQFSYAPVIWMFHSRKLNNQINHIHEREMRLVYKDYTSYFDELLLKDNSCKGITTNSTNPCFILATFQMCFFSPFSILMMKKLSYKYYNKRITTRDNGNV